MHKILIIGGAGFIGSNLVRGLGNGKYHIHICEPEGANVHRLDGYQVYLHRCSLKDTKGLSKIITDNCIDIVVHMVSTLIPGSAYKEYKAEYRNVIFPSIELMEICAERGVKFVFFSSGGTVYGNRDDMFPFKEEDPMVPISYYGWSKQMMENSIQFMHRTKRLEYLIIRPSNPYGHGQNLYGRQGLVAVAIGKILKNEPVEVWGDGSAVRDYIYIDDLVAFFVQLLDNNVGNTTLNIGSGRGYSVNDVLAFLKIVSGKDFKIVYKNPRSVDVSNMVLDLNKLRQHVNIEITPFMQGINMFYEESKKEYSMIRIGIIAGVLHSGGKRNLIMEYYRHIDREKVQFDFICDLDSNGIPTEEIESMGGRIFLVAPYKHIIPHMKGTYRILKENGYPIVHAFDNTLNFFPMFLGWLAGVRIRISESISKGDMNEKKTLIKYALLPFSHWFATDYMANSIDCGKWQFGEGTYRKGEINIFKTVIDTSKNAFDKDLRERTRNVFGWNDKVVYGFIGRYVSQKNPLFLIDIFYEIAKRQENAVFVMIGFGELEEEIMKKVLACGIQDKVRNLGRRDDIRQFYNAFDAFLLPSLYEGMPVVGIEAQCAGLPIFFSKNVTEETTASELAYYIDLNKSPEEWADRIIPVVKKNMRKRRDCAKDVKDSGFDSKSEAIRLQQFYFSLMSI